jgi:hypothetical protein
MINIGFLFILFQKMELKPSEICFSQAEINNVFDKRSCHRNKNLGETLDELVEGRCRISDIPTISVKWMNGKWVTGVIDDSGYSDILKNWENVQPFGSIKHISLIQEN